MGKWDTSVNQFFKSDKKLKKYLKSTKNQNKPLSNIPNNISSFKDMWNIKSIKAMKYDLSSDMSVVYYRSSKREWEGYQPRKGVTKYYGSHFEYKNK